MSESNLPFTPDPPLAPALEAFRMGRMVLLVDPERPARGGVMVAAAERINDDLVNVMAADGRGIICLALLPNHVERLGLTQQAAIPDSDLDRERYTVSIEARDGVTTGISASDRALTIKVASDYRARADMLVTPGHVFPAEAVIEGVLRRPGWAEGSIDLARLSGARPVAAYCHVLDAAGEVALGAELEATAARLQMPIVTMRALIQYRLETESFVSLLTQSTLPTARGPMLTRVFRDDRDQVQHLAASVGDLRGGAPVLVRVHSECLTGDVLHSVRCDCGRQLDSALGRIAEEERGVVVYLRQEGRGIGLMNKVRAYALQDEGRDTVEANEDLGFPADARDFSVAAQILLSIGVHRVRLMTNNPRKVEALERFGIEVVAREAHEIAPSTHNARYLATKREKLGHLLTMS